MAKYGFPQGNVFYRKLGHARPMISHGEGVYLYDRDGKRYLDGSGGAIVVNVGHSRREIIDAVHNQMTEAAYVHGTMFTSESVERFSKALADVVNIDDPRFYYLSSGSEVVEGAIKLARQIQMARGETDRTLIIGRHQSYHGLSMGALSVSDRSWFRAPYTQMFRDMPHIRPPNVYRDLVTGEEAATRLEESILQHGPDRVAAFIAEPISGASLGAAIPPQDYWPIIRQICDHYGVLLIADEVMTGFGRTGKWWGLDHWYTRPDIMVSSKGVASGYFPIGLIAARYSDVDQIATTLGDFSHGGTFSHHAVGAAAGLATIEIIQSEGLVENAARMGTLLGAKLHQAFADHRHVGDIRGRGMLWALEIVEDREAKKPFPVEKKVAPIISRLAFDLGLIIYTSQGCADGANGDLILIGPPLIINEDQITELVESLSVAFERYFN